MMLAILLCYPAVQLSWFCLWPWPFTSSLPCQRQGSLAQLPQMVAPRTRWQDSVAWWAVSTLALEELAGLQGRFSGPWCLSTSVTPANLCICWEALTAICLPLALPVVSSICLSPCHHRLLCVPCLSCQKAVLGLGSHSHAGWPAQLLDDIVLVYPRAEWGHSFCSPCNFSFS